jgi:hypothetical protein
MGPESPTNDLVIVYTGRRDANAAVRLNVPVERVEGIDGRRLPQGPDFVPVPDGLAYVWLTRGWQKAALKPRDAIDSNTTAMRLYRLKADPTPRDAPSLIVMRYLYDPAVVEPKSEGYRVKAGQPGRIPLAVRVFNFSYEARTVRLGLNMVGSREPLRGANKRPLVDERPVFVPPGSSADAKWDVDLSTAFAADDRVKVVVYAAGGQAKLSVSDLVMHFFGEATLMQALGRYEHWLSLPIRDSSRWTPNVAGIGKMQMDSTPEAAWRLQVKFGEGDRWVYPYFKLPDNVRLNEHKGLVIRARCHKPADVRAFLWEGDIGVGYITPHALVPADGQWHVAVVRFGDLAPSGANKPDANNRLDLDQVRRISVGMNTKSPENTLELSDLFVVSDKP